MKDYELTVITTEIQRVAKEQSDKEKEAIEKIQKEAEEKAEIEAEKQKLRDVTTKVDELTTVEELKEATIESLIID